MMVAGTLSPFDRMQVTVMPAGSHERDMGETVRGHGAVCAMAIPVTARRHMHFAVEQVDRSAKSPQYTHRVCTAHSTPSGVSIAMTADAKRLEDAGGWGRNQLSHCISSMFDGISYEQI